MSLSTVLLILPVFLHAAHAHLTIELCYDAQWTPTTQTLVDQFRKKYPPAAAQLSHHQPVRDLHRMETDPHGDAVYKNAANCGSDPGSSLALSSWLTVSLPLSGGWEVATLQAQDISADNAWTVAIGIGTPPQTIKVVLDSGSTDAFFLDPSCSSCELNNHTAFVPAESVTYSNTTSGPFSGSPFAGGGGTSISGYTGNDTLSLSSSVVVNGQVLGLVTSGGISQSTSISGVVGLSRYGDGILGKTAPSVFISACLQRALAAPLFGVALVQAASNEHEQGGGEYNFGFIDQKWVSGDIVYVSTAATNAWGINLTDFTAKGRTLFSPTDPRRAIIDTGAALIFTSDTAAATLHSMIPGSAYLEETQTWTVPCDTSTATGAPNIFFAIGGVNFGIPAADLAFQSSSMSGSCLSGVQNGSPHFTLLGDVFIKNHYIVFDFQSFDVESVVPRIGFANRSDVPPIE